MALKLMNKLVCHGWDIFFHPQLFGVQYQELVDRVAILKQRLSDDEFKTHATVKLFAAITIGIESKIAADPFSSYFALTGTLKRYGRMKKMGLPDRYRLFFRVFDQPESKAIAVRRMLHSLPSRPLAPNSGGTRVFKVPQNWQPLRWAGFLDLKQVVRDLGARSGTSKTDRVVCTQPQFLGVLSSAIWNSCSPRIGGWGAVRHVPFHKVVRLLEDG
jgi:toxin YhaV